MHIHPVRCVYIKLRMVVFPSPTLNIPSGGSVTVAIHGSNQSPDPDAARNHATEETVIWS